MTANPNCSTKARRYKRLQVIETEFASVLKVLQREGNTLSAIVRQAWDTGDLRTMTRRDPLTATGAHVSVIGHITLEELRRYLDATEMASGFANRYLWACVRRSKSLPEGSAIPDTTLRSFVTKAASALDHARRVDEVKRDAPARALWAEHYERLAKGRRGMVGALLARAEAQVLRLSLVYALLDNSKEIRVEHLRAALALWDFCERSIVHVFGLSTGNPDADQILNALRSTTRGLDENRHLQPLRPEPLRRSNRSRVTLLLQEKLANLRAREEFWPPPRALFVRSQHEKTNCTKKAYRPCGFQTTTTRKGRALEGKGSSRHPPAATHPSRRMDPSPREEPVSSGCRRLRCDPACGAPDSALCEVWHPSHHATVPHSAFCCDRCRYRFRDRRRYARILSGSGSGCRRYYAETVRR